VFQRVPRKSKHKHDTARKQAEREAKALSSQKFEFLLDDAPRDEVVVVKQDSKGKERSGREKKDRHLRKREYDRKDWESDEETTRKRRRTDDEDDRDDAASAGEDDADLDIEDAAARRERERLQDLKDRDAFADRVRERDKERTKKVVEDHSSKKAGAAAADAAQRRQLADDSEARVQALPSLRLHSRQEYLTKRELQQIELLRKEIADAEALFQGMKISKREAQELERKKELLKLVEERLRINDTWDGYQLPEDYLTEQGKIDSKKKQNALYKRYEEAKPKDDQFVTDVDQWEASQTRHSTFKTGALDKPDIVDDYEYVFDESQTIKFVMESAASGPPMTAAQKLLQSQIEEAEKRGICQLSRPGPPSLNPSMQPRASRKLGNPYQYTHGGRIFLMLFPSIRSSSSWPRLVRARRPNCLNIFTKRAGPPTERGLHARSLGEWQPCRSRHV
jgi:pre-mRNA-splicing factor ATP-dependent RNA helicase DHX16